MQIDANTVVLFGVLVKIVLGTLFFVFWLRTPRAHWFAWWTATLLFGCISGATILIRGFSGEFFAIGITVAALIAAFGCAWQGARAFEQRPPLWLPLIGAPAIWLAAASVPAFIETIPYRVALSSALVSPLMMAAAYEFWRGRAEPLPSRRPIVVLFASLATIFALRIPLIPVAPFPFGAQLPMHPVWTAAFNFVMFFHAITLAILLVAISKERQEFEQRTRAQTDPLTGALNRRAFMIRGRRLVLRHQKSGEPLCLVFLDLDHFKALNDRHGHSGGDDVLTKFVAVVHDNIRPTDFLFRIGGEEFCCLLPHTHTEQAKRVAERIRAQMEAAAVEVEGEAVKVTVSLGIASTEAFGYDVDTLLRRADMAVYAAKRAGRNRVMMASADDPAIPTGRDPVATLLAAS